MKKQKQQDFMEPVCGNCRFYKAQESEGNMNEPYGLCYAMPPKPYVTDEGLGSIRPAVEIDEIPCAFHQMVAQ
jgi:hypothetical protein